LKVPSLNVAGVNIATTGIVYTSGLVVSVYWKVFANLNTCHGKVLEKSLNVKLLYEGDPVISITSPKIEAVTPNLDVLGILYTNLNTHCSPLLYLHLKYPGLGATVPYSIALHIRAFIVAYVSLLIGLEVHALVLFFC